MRGAIVGAEPGDAVQRASDVHLAEQLAGGVGERLLDFRADTEGLLPPAQLASRGRRVAQAFLAAQLLARSPLDAVRGDASLPLARRRSEGRLWIVASLDGALEYAGGGPDWSVDIALHGPGSALIGAVALPALGLVLSSDSAVPPYPGEGRLRLVVPAGGLPARSARAAELLAARLLPIASVGYGVAVVVRGEADAYVDTAGHREWYSAAPTAVALAASLSVSRADGSAIRYGGTATWVPDFLVCRAELAEGWVQALAQ